MTLSIPLNDQHFPKFMRGLDNGEFLFSKIKYTFYNFFTKRVTGGLFDHYSIVSKEENKKDLVYSLFEGIIFYIKIFVKKSETKILPNSQVTKQSGTRRRRIRNIVSINSWNINK